MLKGIVKTKLSNDINSVLEIVIDGLSFEDISLAMRVGIETILNGNFPGVKEISAGNYGGKLGPHLFYLKKILK